MERTLDKTLQKNNEILAKNKHLKEEIDTLRRERVIFDDIYAQLESELAKKKKLLQEVIKRSDEAKKKRLEVEEQLIQLKVHAKKEEAYMEKRYQNAFNNTHATVAESKGYVSMGTMTGAALEDPLISKAVEKAAKLPSNKNDTDSPKKDPISPIKVQIFRKSKSPAQTY
jgi:hypothetical protein